MNTLNKLLDKARELCGSDLATAAKLGVTRSAVSKWRHGGKIDPAHIAKLITLTQQDPALAVQVMAEQDASPEEHRMWGVVWDRLSPVTSTVAGVLLVVGLAAPFRADAALTDAILNVKTASALCAKRLRKIFAAFAAWWQHEPSAMLA